FSPDDQGESERKAGHARPVAAANPPSVFSGPRSASGGSAVASTRAGGASTAHAGGLPSAAPARGPRATASAGVRRPSLDRLGDAGPARRHGREPPGRSNPAACELSSRVPARLGQQDLLHAASPRSSAA